MTNIFITGDRSMDPMLAAGLVKATILDILTQHGPSEVALGTGNAAYGIERAVRYLMPDDRLNILEYTLTEEGKPDFAAGFETLRDQTDLVVFLHPDPLDSSIGKALSAVFPPEKIQMPVQDALSYYML